MVARPTIPKQVELDILYRGAYACALCQKPTIQIHHIDKNPTNNDPRNLVILCQEHHGEAHTIRELTIMLTPERLRSVKMKSESDIAARRINIVSVDAQKAAAGDFLSVGVSWGYINHRRVASFLTSKIIDSVDSGIFENCLNRNLIDSSGLIISREISVPNTGYIGNSIYNQFAFGDDHRVHSLYSSFVDVIAKSCSAVHVSSESYTKAWVNHFSQPGTFLFLNQGHWFRDKEDLGTNIVRLAYTKKRNVRFEYLVETRDMFGTSSMTVSFKGHRTAAALVMVKSIDDVDTTTVHCTPLALGTGYWPLRVLDGSQQA